MEDNSALYDVVLHGFNATPFNQLIGLRIESIAADCCVARFNMRPELIGNGVHKILHGGVTSSVLDTIGGAVATIGAWERMHGLEKGERIRRLGRLGTLDMRIDYLAPGRGAWFEATGRILRAGNKVMVTRMELNNDAGDLLATGTATYLY